jgi:hypothetical protein
MIFEAALISTLCLGMAFACARGALRASGNRRDGLFAFAGFLVLVWVFALQGIFS